MNSLEQIASAIYNHIAAGLKATGNEPYQIEQIKDEIIVERNALLKIEEMANRVNGSLMRSLLQSIECVEVDCDYLALCCEVDTYDKALHFKIPTLASFIDHPLKYVGPVNRSEAWAIVWGSTWKTQKYSKYTKDKTYVWIHPKREGIYQHGFIFNPPTEDLKYISVDALFENPLDLVEYECCVDIEETAANIPNWMVSAIIDKIQSRFASNFYRLNYKRNDQTGH